MLEYLTARVYTQKRFRKRGLVGMQGFDLTEDEFQIGYVGHGNDFGINDKIGGRVKGLPQLSRDHCKITLKDGVRHIHDLGSRTGTYVNGERISEKGKTSSRKLESGDVISLIPKGEGFLVEIEYWALQ